MKEQKGERGDRKDDVRLYKCRVSTSCLLTILTVHYGGELRGSAQMSGIRVSPATPIMPLLMPRFPHLSACTLVSRVTPVTHLTRDTRSARRPALRLTRVV